MPRYVEPTAPYEGLTYGPQRAYSLDGVTVVLVRRYSGYHTKEGARDRGCLYEVHALVDGKPGVLGTVETYGVGSGYSSSTTGASLHHSLGGDLPYAARNPRYNRRVGGAVDTLVGLATRGGHKVDSLPLPAGAKVTPL